MYLVDKLNDFPYNHITIAVDPDINQSITLIQSIKISAGLLKQLAGQLKKTLHHCVIMVP